MFMEKWCEKNAVNKESTWCSVLREHFFFLTMNHLKQNTKLKTRQHRYYVQALVQAERFCDREDEANRRDDQMAYL